MQYNDSLRNITGFATILLSLAATITFAAEPIPELSLRNTLLSQTQCDFPGGSISRKRVDFSADGQFYVHAGRDGRIRYGRTEDGAALRTFYMCCPQAVALSPDGRFIAAIGRFNGCTSELKVWNARDGSVLWTMESEFGGQSLSFSDNGIFLASIANDTVELWNLQAGLRVRVETVPKSILRIAFNRANDGSLVLLCDDGKPRHLSLPERPERPNAD